MAAGAPALENQNEIEICKLRIEEYRGRYESMRNLEWSVLVQAYTGYTAIGFAFWKLTPWHGDWRVCDLAMVVTLLFFLVTQYLCFRIQERLITFGVTYENWMEKMYLLRKVNLSEDQGPGTRKLGHQYFWTFNMQLLLALFTCLGLLSYEYLLSWHTPQLVKRLLLILWLCLTGIAVMAAYASWYIARTIYREISHRYRPVGKSTIWMERRRQPRRSGT